MHVDPDAAVDNHASRDYEINYSFVAGISYPNHLLSSRELVYT